MSEKSNYEKLAAIDVGSHIEKKNNLSYLSWAWAVDQLLRCDHSATWEYKEPVKFGETMMVFCTVTAFGKSMTSQLPVMNHRNQAIPNPDAFQVNTAMQRCLAKAIALHGLGLYIYAGEDLPLVEVEPITEEQIIAIVALADEVGANMPAFLKFLKVKELAELTSSSYEPAIKALEAKRKK